MGKTILIWLIVGAITSANLVVFIHCVPLLCEVWGANRLWMSALFLGLIIWVESLSNIWKAALRIRNPVYLLFPAHARRMNLLQPTRGGESNV